MGHEYRITCTREAVSRISDLIVRLGAERLNNSEQEMFEIRFHPEKPTAMADAIVVLEKESVYFCDNMRSADACQFFVCLLNEALTYSDSDSVQITAL